MNAYYILKLNTEKCLQYFVLKELLNAACTYLWTNTYDVRGLFKIGVLRTGVIYVSIFDVSFVCLHVFYSDFHRMYRKYVAGVFRPFASILINLREGATMLMRFLFGGLRLARPLDPPSKGVHQSQMVTHIVWFCEHY